MCMNFQFFVLLIADTPLAAKLTIRRMMGRRILGVEVDSLCERNIYILIVSIRILKVSINDIDIE